MQENAAFLARLVDSLLRGRAQPSIRHEAAAAVSHVRAFVHAWRPNAARTAARGMSVIAVLGEAADIVEKKCAPPAADALLKLAQVCGYSSLALSGQFFLSEGYVLCWGTTTLGRYQANLGQHTLLRYKACHF